MVVYTFQVQNYIQKFESHDRPIYPLVYHKKVLRFVAEVNFHWTLRVKPAANNALAKYGAGHCNFIISNIASLDMGLDRFRLNLVGSFNFTFQFIISTGQTNNKFPELRQCRPLGESFFDTTIYQWLLQENKNINYYF